MKKVILLGLVMLGIAGKAVAYEIADNPDRKMSIGVGYDYLHFGGDFTSGSGTFHFPDSQSSNESIFGINLRAPLNSALTFTFGGSYITSKSDFTTSQFTGINQSSDLKGFDIGFGFRIYIP